MDLDGLRDVTPTTSKMGGMKFSKTEIRDIIISILVLCISFTIAMLSGINKKSITTELVIYVFGISVLAVVTSFLCHELGHKYVAQSYGAWSEFRMFPLGLFLCLMLSFTGFLFAAPGAVVISGRITQEQYGKISLAGPAVNFTIAALAFAFFLLTGISGAAAFIIVWIAFLNAFMGLFNMVPIPPLDGSKVIRWSVPIYLVALAVGIIETVLCYITLYG